MAVTEPAPLARYDFSNGAMRGSHLSLYATCLVHRGDFHLETLPLAAFASVRVAFERNAARVGWGVACILLALVCFAISAPLVGLAAGAAVEVSSGQTGLAAALTTVFRALEALARALPFLGALGALGGGTLVALGWIGTTTLTLSFAGGARDYPVRGRDTRLLDFAELLSQQIGERVTQPKR